MTAYRPVLDGTPYCNSCASLAGLVLCFIACFILLVIAHLEHTPVNVDKSVWPGTDSRPCTVAALQQQLCWKQSDRRRQDDDNDDDDAAGGPMTTRLRIPSIILYTLELETD